MIKIKDKSAIEKMRIAGKRLATVMEKVKNCLKVGISTLEVNDFIEKEMVASGLKPACKGYAGYQHASCISINDGVVHGVPSEKIVLKNGDLVKIDVVASYKGYCADMARCFFVGEVSSVARKLVRVAQQALDKAVENIQPGMHLSDISACIQREVEGAGFNIVRAFAGHGIGKSLHEEPEIPNFGEPGKGPRLQPGMVLAIEPMITEGGYELFIDKDGWTAKTRDGSLSGHVEDTVVVTECGAEVLTRLK